MIRKKFLRLYTLMFAILIFTSGCQKNLEIDTNILPETDTVQGFASTDNANITSKFNLQRGVVMLNSGYEMPILGIGTYLLSNTQAENSVYHALKDGYRLIDTARIYGNEEGVGRGIKRAFAR